MKKFTMQYYIKKLGKQELGSIGTDGKVHRGRYIYISKEIEVLKMFPPLSQTQTNDSSYIAIIPLYLTVPKKIWCKFIYHNDKYTKPNGTRNEYRIYSTSELEDFVALFQPDDFLVFTLKPNNPNISDKNLVNSSEDSDFEYYLYRCNDKQSKLYSDLLSITEQSSFKGGHAVFTGNLPEIDSAIAKFNSDNLVSVIDNSTFDDLNKMDVNAASSMEHLFNSASFHDFVLAAYNNKCAITGTVIRYNSFMNLESAHIIPHSHNGLFLPNNGIAMSRDMHWAFDKGFFTISNNYRIIVHPDVASGFLGNFNNKKIFVPASDFFKPALQNLSYHQKNIFGLFKHSGSLTMANGYDKNHPKR